MQDSIDRQPDVHIYFDDRASWVVVNDDLPRLGGSSVTNLVAARLILAAPGGASPESPLSGPTIRHRTYGPEY
jgi:hypothetical protein